MTEPSIFPIRQLYFQCTGCKTQWMLRVDPPITSIDEFKAFTADPNRMERCPNACGAKTCNIAFRAGTPPPGTTPGGDPFDIFEKKS